DVGARPGKIALQPDGKKLWAMTDKGTAVVPTADQGTAAVPAAGAAASSPLLPGTGRRDAARPAGGDAGGPLRSAYSLAFSNDFAFVARAAALDVFNLHSMERTSIALDVDPRV